MRQLDSTLRTKQFSADRVVLCEGESEFTVTYQAPPGFVVSGNVSVSDVREGKGSYGKVKYLKDKDDEGSVTKVEVPFSCTSSKKLDGPSTDVIVRLEGELERVITTSDRIQIEQLCVRSGGGVRAEKVSQWAGLSMVCRQCPL
jgi:hypothetical protein